MLAHPKPKNKRSKLNMFEIKEGQDEDLLLESKKNKAEARKERMREDNSGAKKSIYFIHNKV